MTEALAKLSSNAQGAAKTHEVFLMPHTGPLDVAATARRAHAVCKPVLLQADPEAFLRETTGEQLDAGQLSEQEIESMIEQRLAARQDRNWGEADRIRDELESRGIVLEDGASGTTWRRN